ncbi:MFS transporter [Streptacidiphilus fuscans]|uniref:MFS transporter n=1 Tax=Streptacidiphilus fuscans TaxID=2789292 RepID=A0A931B719_9ACTN|nr:MFS transporter [Streptacidiphilus fuscans]MBF9069038.1 MFS transporter [Streptacidiphilus fuscans]
MADERTALAAAPATAKAAARPGSWRQLALLSGLISMDSSESSVVSVLFPALRSALGLPLSALGALVAAGKVAGMVTGPLWVMLAQRMSRKTVLVVSSGLWGLWSVAAGLAQNYVQLLVLATVASAGFAGGSVLVNGILADMFDDTRRGRAAGYLYAGVAVLLAVVSPVLGLLSRVHDGWRYGFFTSGGVTVLFGVLVAAFFRDPGVGAAEQVGEDRRRFGGTTLTWPVVRELLGSSTIRLILVQRLFNTQLALLSFGVVYLVDVFHFSNAESSLVSAPASLCYLAGTAIGGVVVDRAQRRLPDTGRLLTWQLATVGWGLVALLATQVAWPSIGWYVLLFCGVGVLQGFNPGCNRPILMAVARPETRSAAFALMLSAESAGWALSTLAIGYAGSAFGLRTAVLWLIVVLTFANGLFMTTIYRPLRREARAMRAATDETCAPLHSTATEQP